MNRYFSKILIIAILVVVVVGGVFAWQYFGTQKEPKIISFEVVPSQKTEEGIVYEEGARAVVIGQNLTRVEFRQRGGGQIYTDPEGGLVGMGVKKETQGGKAKWEVLLPSERLMSEFCALAFNAQGEKIGETCLFNIFDAADGDETANWQTYRNDEYGFEITYPSYFQYRESSSPSMVDFHSSTLVINNINRGDHLVIEVISKALTDIEFSPESGGGELYRYNRDAKQWRLSTDPEYEGRLLEFAPKQHQTKNNYTAHYVQTGHVCTQFEKALIENPTQEFVIELFIAKIAQVEDCTGPGDPVPLTDRNTIFSLLDSIRFTK